MIGWVALVLAIQAPPAEIERAPTGEPPAPHPRPRSSAAAPPPSAHAQREANAATAPPTASEIEAAALRDLKPKRVLSLEECVRTARGASPDLQIADSAIAAADAARKSTRGRFGPALVLDSSLQFWAEEVTVDFSPPGLMLDVDPIVVQERVTSRVAVNLIQPLTGLWGITEAHRVSKLGRKAAKAQKRATRQNVELAVSSAYYDALKAERLVVVAALTIATIEALLERSKTFEAAGVLGRHQVLETEVRLAEARSLLIEAKAGVKLARANLAFQMGLPVESDLGPAGVAVETTAARPSLEATTNPVSTAYTRPDIQALEHRAEQARRGRKLAASALLPQLSAMASYQRTDGLSFALNDQFFVGLTLRWTAWDWGATPYGIPQAKAQERQAKLALEKAKQGVRLEVVSAQTQVETARQRREQARVAVEAAAENLRLVAARFDASAATSTEVLDAVARKARAEASETTAYYDILKARAALRKASGQPVYDAGRGT